MDFKKIKMMFSCFDFFQIVVPLKIRKMNLVTALQQFVTQYRPCLLVQHYYPVRAHSYLPPDRVFGRIERSLRRRETVLLPEEYNNVEAEHATVRVIGSEWDV